MADAPPSGYRAYYLVHGSGSAGRYVYDTRTGVPANSKDVIYVGATDRTSNVWGRIVARSHGWSYDPSVYYAKAEADPSTLDALGAGLAFLGGSVLPDAIGAAGGLGAAGKIVRPGGAAAAGAAASKANTVAGDASKATKAAGLAGGALAIADTKDFLSFISWLFHPINWLRAVEFATGGILMLIGLRSSTRTFRQVAVPTPWLRRTLTRRAIARHDYNSRNSGS